jgi:hypothetical protein
VAAISTVAPATLATFFLLEKQHDPYARFFAWTLIFVLNDFEDTAMS